MHVKILSDAEAESGILDVIVWLAKTNYWEAFQQEDYGDGLENVSMFLICRDPGLGFRRRIRHLKKEKRIYIDVMLQVSKFTGASVKCRKEMVIESLLKDVPPVIRKYKVEDFECEKFLLSFSRNIGLLLEQI